MVLFSVCFVSPHLDWGGYSVLPMSGGGGVVLPSQVRYASCIHAGRLSCSLLVFSLFRLKYEHKASCNRAFKLDNITSALVIIT